MRIAMIVVAVLVGLLGLRLVLTAIRTVILFIKMENVPLKAKESLFRDLVWGIVCLILAFALLT